MEKLPMQPRYMTRNPIDERRQADSRIARFIGGGRVSDGGILDDGSFIAHALNSNP